MKKSRPLLIWSSILVTLQILTGGAVLAEFIGADLAALAILSVASLQGGTQFYVQGLVTPMKDLSARARREVESR